MLGDGIMAWLFWYQTQVDDYELCKLDFSECQGPIGPGETCNVTCNEGFNVNLNDWT